MNKLGVSFSVKKMLSTAFAAVMSLGVASSASADAVLHAFDWSYDQVAAAATDIKNAGYKAVLVVPPLKSDSANTAWWSHYQPQDLRVIDHSRGNKESFVRMINALKDANAARNVDVYADIVLNHMANERNGSTTFPGPAAVSNYISNSVYWNKQKLFGDLTVGLFGSGDFNPAVCIGDYNDVWQVQNYRICGAAPDTGLPDTNPNSWVVQQQRNYLQGLKDLGVKGFRMDAAKHMTNWHLNQILTPTIKSGMYVFGEIITGGGSGEISYDRFLAPYLSQTDHKAYDFPLFATIRNAFSINGSLASLSNPVSVGQALQNDRALTFVITHDIPTNSGFRYQIMDPVDEQLGYAYILGRDGGKPLVFSDSTGTDNGRWVGVYKNLDMINRIKFHNRTQGQTMEVLASNSCAILFRRGEQGIVGINKCTTAQNFTVNTNSRFKWYVNYRDVLSGGALVNITSSTYTFSLPGRLARMWLPE